MINVVVLWGLHEEVVVLVPRGDPVLSAYPRTARPVVLVLRNRLQSLSGSFDIRLAKFATYFKPLIIVSPRLAAERFATHLSCSRCDKYFLFTDRSRLLLLCFFPAFSVLGDWGRGGGVFLLVTVFR